MSLMAANEESDPSAILNGFWVTLLDSCILAKSVFRLVYNYLRVGETDTLFVECRI